MFRPHFSIPIAVALFSLACSETDEAPLVTSQAPIDVVLVTWDTVRFDHVGAPTDPETGAMSNPSSTPTWDRFAREGTVFTEARTTAPVTLPAHASILTGLQPPRHGVRDNGIYALPESVSTLAEEFAKAGYANAAFVSSEVLHPRHGLDRGFEHYDYFVRRAEGTLSLPERRANTTVDSAIDWLGRTPIDRPLFLWVHLFDPHRVWDAPAPWRDQHDPYRAEIAFADAQTGRLLDHLAGLGRLPRSLVVMTSDHGESLGEHGEITHSYFAYDSTLRVPLLFWAGRKAGISIASGARVDGIVSLVDLAPTLRSLANLPERPTDGRSLVPQLAGAPVPERLLPFESVSPAMGYGTAPTFGVVSSTGEVWFDLPRRERFDIARDPGQTRNLYSAKDDPVADALFARFPRDWPPSGSTLDLDSESRENLVALGYAIGSPASAATVSVVDPKDRVDAHGLVASDQSVRKAQRVLEDFTALRAKHGPVPALVTLEIDLLVWLGRFRDALELAHEAVRAHPNRKDLADILDGLVKTWQAKQNRITEIRAALGHNPGDAKLLSEQAALIASTQEHAEAESLYREILANAPDDHEAVINLAGMFVSLERDDEAVALLLALRSKPGYAARYDCLAGNLLARIDGQLGQSREAISACAAGGGELSPLGRAVLDGTYEGLAD